MLVSKHYLYICPCNSKNVGNIDGVSFLKDILGVSGWLTYKRQLYNPQTKVDEIAMFLKGKLRASKLYPFDLAFWPYVEMCLIIECYAPNDP